MSLLVFTAEKSGSRPLVLATLSKLSLHGTPLGYPVAALCSENPEAVDLQDWCFHFLQQISDAVDNGVGLPRSLVLGLGSCRGGQSVRVLPCPHHCPVLPWRAHPLHRRAGDRASSPAL